MNDLKYRPRQKLRFVFTASSLFLLSAIHFVFPCHARAQLSTFDHLQYPGFWPTKMYSSLEEFAGSAVCAQCHKEISTSQRMTPMARTLARADGSAVLREHPELGFDPGNINFEFPLPTAKAFIP